MHPAPSVILFTVLSGMGLGLLTFLTLGLPAVTGWAAFWAYGAGFALTVGGLVSSTFHLGNPQRALKAFTQWRSSWLSREAWAAVLALAVAGCQGAGAVFLGQTPAFIGISSAILCLATIFATSMIYAQIRAVPRWHQAGTPVLFLTAALAGGALLAGQSGLAAALLVATLACQLWVWHVGDRAFANAGSTLGSATGLGPIGAVRPFEPPHTGENYLLREMAFVIGRKHSKRLRLITISFAVVIPLCLLAIGGGALWAAWAGAALHFAGMLAGRWLFFAEAEHVVGLYYGRRAA